MVVVVVVVMVVMVVSVPSIDFGLGAALRVVGIFPFVWGLLAIGR